MARVSAERDMPETPDFANLAAQIMARACADTGGVSPDEYWKDAAASYIAEHLRAAWDARGAADLAAVELPSRPSWALTRAARTCGTSNKRSEAWTAKPNILTRGSPSPSLTPTLPRIGIRGPGKRPRSSHPASAPTDRYEAWRGEIWNRVRCSWSPIEMDARRGAGGRRDASERWQD
jgi:hypothetical protein